MESILRKLDAMVPTNWRNRDLDHSRGMRARALSAPHGIQLPKQCGPATRLDLLRPAAAYPIGIVAVRAPRGLEHPDRGVHASRRRQIPRSHHPPVGPAA